MDDGFTQLLGRDVDVVGLSAGGATDEEMTVLAEVLDEVEAEETAVGLANHMKSAGLLW